MASPAFRSQTTVTPVAQTSFNTTLPAGSAAGDFLFLTVRLDTALASPKTVAASGMTPIGQIQQATDGWTVAFFWDVGDGSTAPSVTWDGTSLIAGGLLAAFSGADQTAPLNFAGGVGPNNDGFDTSAPVGLASVTVTTSVPETLLVVSMVNVNGANVTPTADFTERADTGSFELCDQAVSLPFTPQRPTFTTSASCRVMSTMVAVAAHPLVVPPKRLPLGV